MKKYILPITAGIWPYLLFAVFLFVKLSHSETPGPVPLWPVLIVLYILVCGPLLGLLCLLVGFKNDSLSPDLLAKWSLAVKLAHLPFYCFIYFLFLIVPIFWFFLLVFDVMALCISGGFGIAAILRARKEGSVTTGWSILHIIAHCFFIMDIISGFLVWKRLRTVFLPLSRTGGTAPADQAGTSAQIE